ncbi:hypothetical protein V8C40DRAFT_279294 [Trichoderma camerunense]
MKSLKSLLFQVPLILDVAFASDVITDPENATTFALTYGFPLLGFAQVSLSAFKNGGVNQLQRSPGLANASSTSVVTPNVDTLYGIGIFDLAVDDIVVTIPSIPENERYYSYAFFDPFGSNFFNLESEPVSIPPGKYLLRRGSKTWGFEKSNNKEYQGYIDSPTGNGVFLTRIEVKNNNTDVMVVEGYLNGTNMSPIPRESGDPIPESPPLTPATFAALEGLSTPQQTLELTARLQAANPPFNVTDVAFIDATLFAAGIHNGTYHQPAGVDLEKANSLADAEIGVYTQAGRQLLGNQWARYNLQGLYGNNFAARSLLAQIGYLNLQESQAIYPFSLTEEGGTTSIAHNEALLYTFVGGKPPTLSPEGFWSVTMYDAEHFLIANSLNVYALGDRSNLTYPDGTPVYGPTSGPENDARAFQILIQAADIAPPINWTNNWLPAPSNGNFSTVLRLYGPTSALTDGSWTYPTVSKIPAITM